MLLHSYQVFPNNSKDEMFKKKEKKYILQFLSFWGHFTTLAAYKEEEGILSTS